MTLSVIMSVYKSDKDSYLQQALKSIWDDQTQKPSQIVLIIDGPLGKDLHDKISQWKTKLGKDLIILVNRQNLGLTKSLNRALGVATGDLIARMDADDISLPHRFETQINYLKEHPEVTILGGSIQEFDDSSDCLGVRKYPQTAEDVRRSIHKGNPLAHSSVMFRRSLYLDGNKYNEKFRKNQDLELWFRAVKSGYQINNLNDIIVKFRRNPAVFRRRGKGSAVMEFKIYVKGIYSLYGPYSFKYIYPFARFIFRLMPRDFIQKVYNSTLRKLILEK